jgi:uncharacterized protein (DUF433 family)
MASDDWANLPEFLTRDDDGHVHVTGHRIGLQHLVYFYNQGQSPEMLACQFPTLSLALIHKAIAFYLENRDAVDRYVVEDDAEIERQRAASPKGPSLAELRRRLEARRRAEAL